MTAPTGDTCPLCGGDMDNQRIYDEHVWGGCPMLDSFARDGELHDLGHGRLSDRLLEAAAFELYAAGPWGELYELADGGVRAITDAHTMDVYRRMVRLAWDTIHAEAGK